MKIFISHSQKDKVAANEFKKLFEKFAQVYPGTQEVFLSSNISDDQIKTGEWKKDFEKHLKESNVFVVLVTPNSLNSTWVTYEIGYALALEGTRNGIEKIVPVGIRGVDPQSFFLNSYNMQIVKTEGDLIDLLNRVFGSTKKFNEIWCKENEESVNSLLLHCVEKCVYFVGSNWSKKSKKEGTTEEESKKDESSRNKWNKELIEDFLVDITKKLIEKGIKVSSFPNVEGVGNIVSQIALKERPQSYEISGLYEFDNIAENLNIAPQTWKETLDKFRLYYLENKSSMVIIGGGKHTREEYDVAKKHCKHMEFFPLPCMGGTGEELFVKDIKHYEKVGHPCVKCDYGNQLKCPMKPEFITRLGTYIHKKKDGERES